MSEFHNIQMKRKQSTSDETMQVHNWYSLAADETSYINWLQLSNWNRRGVRLADNSSWVLGSRAQKALNIKLAIKQNFFSKSKKITLMAMLILYLTATLLLYFIVGVPTSKTITIYFVVGIGNQCFPL